MTKLDIVDAYDQMVRENEVREIEYKLIAICLLRDIFAEVFGWSDELISEVLAFAGGKYCFTEAKVENAVYKYDPCDGKIRRGIRWYMEKAQFAFIRGFHSFSQDCPETPLCSIEPDADSIVFYETQFYKTLDWDYDRSDSDSDYDDSRVQEVCFHKGKYYKAFLFRNKHGEVVHGSGIFYYWFDYHRIYEEDDHMWKKCYDNSRERHHWKSLQKKSVLVEDKYWDSAMRYLDGKPLNGTTLNEICEWFGLSGKFSDLESFYQE